MRKEGTHMNGGVALSLPSLVAHPPPVFNISQLPDRHGLDILRDLRRSDSPRLQQTAVVIVSAVALDDEREKAMKEGADAYLTKPIRLSALRQTLWEVVMSHRAKNVPAKLSL